MIRVAVLAIQGGGTSHPLTQRVFAFYKMVRQLSRRNTLLVRVCPQIFLVTFGATEITR